MSYDPILMRWKPFVLTATLVLAGCAKAPPPPQLQSFLSQLKVPGHPHEPLPKDVELYNVEVNVPSGTDQWVFATQYSLNREWNNLNISISSSDLRHIVECSQSIDAPLLVCITDGKVTETGYLDSRIRITGTAFAVTGGDRLCLMQMSGSDYFVLHKWDVKK